MSGREPITPASMGARRLGVRVRTARLASGLSLRQAAERAGVHRDTWDRVERGHIGRIDSLDAIGLALGWRPGDALRIIAVMPELDQSLTLVHVNDGSHDFENYAIVDTAVLTELSDEQRAEIVTVMEQVDHGPRDALSWHTAGDLPVGVLLVRHVLDGPKFITILAASAQVDRIAAAANLHAQRLIEGEGWRP